MRGAVTLAAMALSACTATQADHGADAATDLAEALAERSAGAARRCISASLPGGPQIIGDTLLYREGRRLWVSRAVGGCPSLRGDPIPIIEVFGGLLCENDRFRTVQRGSIGIPGPYCRFGPFTPYTEAK